MKPSKDKSIKTVRQPEQAFKPYLMMFKELGGERGVKRKRTQLPIIIFLHRKGKHLKKNSKTLLGGDQLFANFHFSRGVL